MNRRTLFSLGLAGTAAGLILPRTVFAERISVDLAQLPMAGGLYYTKSTPGRWAGKESGHVPMIERRGSSIEVTTGHEMDGFHHYIVKHVILDERFDVVTETMFDPRNDSPVSQHSVRGLRGTVYAVSLCNKHDAWISALKI